MVVSADCHAGPLPDQARTYVDPEFRDAFDEWLADDAARARRQAEHTGQAIYGDEALEDFTALDAVSEGGLDGGMDSARRLAELEADGIVAEVIYPGGGGLTISPFDAGLDDLPVRAGSRDLGRRLSRLQPLAGRLLQRGARAARRRRARHGRRSRRDRPRSRELARPRHLRRDPAPEQRRSESALQPPPVRAVVGGVRRTPSADPHPHAVGRRTTETSPAHSGSSSPRSRGSRIVRSGCSHGRACSSAIRSCGW